MGFFVGEGHLGRARKDVGYDGNERGSYYRENKYILRKSDFYSQQEYYSCGIVPTFSS